MDELKFDTIEEDFPRLTEKNVKLINFIMKNDSNYRIDNDENNMLSTANLVKQYKNNPSRNNLKQIIKAIDKQNSTHLSASGTKKGNNTGIDNTTDYIFYKIGIDNLSKQIYEGNSLLVDDIATNSIANRYIISFASKFCTYMSRYMFDDDKFSIYDGIMASILPYYYFKYVNNEEKITINNNKIKIKGYQWYRTIIDNIIKGTLEKEKYLISREDLDHLLWYYYKGDKNIKKGKELCYKSRITRALETIRNDVKS